MRRNLERLTGQTLRWVLASAIGLLGLAAPGSAAAVSVGLELLVTVNGGSAASAFGGPDAASDVPLSLQVSPGDSVEVRVLIDFGLPIRQYQSALLSDDPASLDYVSGSAVDLSTLGFLPLADPDQTLQDGTPESGDADSNACVPLACTAPSTNSLYELSWIVAPGFAEDALRDVTVQLESIQFDDAANSLDALRDTASILLVVPEPADAVLLALALGTIALLRARRRT